MGTDEETGGAIRVSSLVITNEVLSLIGEIDEFKGAWRAIGRLAPERLSRLRRVATIEGVGSSTRIEGVQLDDSQVEQVLSRIGITSFVTRDEQEVAGYADVMETILSHADSIDLTQNHIKQLHGDLLKYAQQDAWHRGEYKTLANHVEAFDSTGNSQGIVFETASPFDTPRLMTELTDWTRSISSQGELHPLLTIAVFVVVFLEIHPFQDGNGRLSRVLTTLLLLRAGYGYVTYSSMESIIEQSKQAYYVALRKTQGSIRTDAPDWQPWITYFLRTMKLQKDRLARKIEREQIIGELPELSVQILEIAREQGRVTVGELAKLTGASRNTIKDHVKALTRKGHLKRHGAGRGTWYARG